MIPPDEKKQLAHRHPAGFVRRTLEDFNAGTLDAITAASHLGVSRSRLYELRGAFLCKRADYGPKTSGGDRSEDWPAETRCLLEEFLPCKIRPTTSSWPTNSSASADSAGHAPRTRPTSKHTMRIWCLLRPASPGFTGASRREHIGELWQHDSSVHQWWPAHSKQTLLLTVDDASGLNLAGRFVGSDTTWNHFEHFREAFTRWGLPEILYTDGLSLFEPSSTDDHSDPKSEFQRAILGLGSAHLVAPTPQAKGKIERRFGTFQRRLVTLLAHARATTWAQADAILQMEIKRQNLKLNRSCGKIPLEVWETQSLRGHARPRPPPPPALLDLHLSLRLSRRVNNDHTVDFDGRNYEISSTPRKRITIVHHPKRQFWVVENPPKDVWPSILAHYTL